MPHKRPRILDQGFCFAKLFYSSHPISYSQEICILNSYSWLLFSLLNSYLINIAPINTLLG